MMQNDYSWHIRVLFSWYDTHRRDLPWRKDRNPYTSWISEVMLQQTRVETVIPYYKRFITLFPDIRSLAAAETDDVYKAWEGLGYYSRAANLIEGAKYILESHGGVFPNTMEDIQKIPGIGPYIAAAILSMAFGEPEPSVDGNLIRVISRLNALNGASDASSTRKTITVIARKMIARDRPGDFNEAMMDIGATICTPKSPGCGNCPFRDLCAAYKLGKPELFPGSKKTAFLPSCPITVCAVLRGDTLWVRKRPSGGLLGGLYEFPIFPGHLSEEDVKKALFPRLACSADISVHIESLPASTHRFSHMIWKMKGYRIDIESGQSASVIPFIVSEENNKESGMFVSLDECRKLAFPAALRIYTKAVFSTDASKA